MTLNNPTTLDGLLSKHTVNCHIQPANISPEELVHIAGAQEPVRDHPDERARTLLVAGWLTIEYVEITIPENARTGIVAALQKTARAWLKEAGSTVSDSDREQVRWLFEKTRSHESKQQIAQRIWLAAAIYGLGLRGLHFDGDGQIHWGEGMVGRIGLAPDIVLDLAWSQPNHQIFTASFRQPDGTITRGKGRQRWHVYRLTINSAAKPLFDHRAQQTQQRVALIVASQTYATQPQLPRDFYGGDAFQQACIDAQDQPYNHILVLSPAHGVISLDDTVPTEVSWDTMLERRVWEWQIQAVQRLGRYLVNEPHLNIPHPNKINWWAWLHPDSTYEFTIFGSGFAVRVLMDHLTQSSERQPKRWPVIILNERRPGYDADDFDSDYSYTLDEEEDTDGFSNWDDTAIDLDQLMDLANEFIGIVNLYVPPTGETWELAADEALLPIRLLTNSSMSIDNLLDLLTDIMLLLESPLPISLLLNANMVVAVMLQVTHTIVHDERESIPELLSVVQEPILHHYVEKALQEVSLEDQLCACLTLTEQMQLLATAIPQHINDQIMVWLQTYLSARLRQRLLGNRDDAPPIEEL